MIRSVLSTVGLIGRVVSKILPGKPKAVIEGVVNDLITSDEEIQKQIEQERQHILSYEGMAKDLPRVCLILREAGRPFVLVIYTLTFIGYYLVTGRPPHPLIVNIAKWVALSYITSRGVEKIVKTLKG